MIIIRRFQAATLDDIEHNPKYQIIMIGVLMPIFLVHTILGGEEFLLADMYTCRQNYDGEVFYIIVFMFAVSMCFVFVLLLFCILLPIWIRKLRRRRRTTESKIWTESSMVIPFWPRAILARMQFLTRGTTRRQKAKTMNKEEVEEEIEEGTRGDGMTI